MNTYIFSLEEYFEKTQKYYYFFDGLIAYEKKLKKDVLKTVDIYETSYRADRLKSKVKNGNKIILLNHFGYNEIDINSQLKYEICISKIYYCTYYVKFDILQELLNEIDTYISENNYLKPLFILFKIFGTIPFHNRHSELCNIFSEEIKYLKSFMKTNYFTDEIAYLYSVIMLYFNVENNIQKLDEYSNTFRELRWFDYTIRANYYYINEKDADSLMYYNAALDEFQKAYNIERYLRTINNVASAYNNLDKYQFSINITEKVIKYAFSQEVNIWVKSIAMHYLFSNYMLKRYEEVIEFYNVIVLNDDFLNEISIIIIILSAFYLNKLSLISGLIEKNKNLKNVQMFLSAIDNINNKKIVDLSEIEPIPYLIKIGATLQ